MSEVARTDEVIVQMLEATRASMDDARKTYVATFKACFPVGAYVRWKIGHYVNAGTVTDHSNFEAVLFVTDTRGKRQRINDYSILQALKGV